jgi:hypothetical protein
MKTKFFLSAVAVLALNAFAGEPFTQGTFTDVIKDVNVVAASTKAATPAAVNAVVKAPDLVRTGPASRAEITAPDQTITRIGANTVFSFDPTSRTVNLEQGSVLFHSPKGKGGGVIKSGGASAAVLGTTVICVKGADGTFKTILLEGEVKVTLADGKTVTLHDGQMVIVSADGQQLSKIYDINLENIASGALVSGFSHELPSWPLIQDAIRHQKSLLAKGAQDGGGSQPQGNQIDNNTFQTLVPPNFGNAGKQRPPVERPPVTAPGNTVGGPKP